FLCILLMWAAATAAAERLSSRPRLEPVPGQSARIGATIATERGERRRVVLPDGSTLYLNEQTRVQVADARRLKVDAGDVYIDIAPATGADKNFVLDAAERPIRTQGARLLAVVRDGNAAIVVVRGQVEVEGVKEPLHAGQVLSPGSKKPQPAARIGPKLEWARDLIAAADSPLVPGSTRTGGALVTVDPDGQESKLTLRKLHIDVHIEDGFARTTIDQTYFNEQPSRLEGTFYFPPPAA